MSNTVEITNCPTCGHFPAQAIATEIEKGDGHKAVVWRALSNDPPERGPIVGYRYREIGGSPAWRFTPNSPDTHDYDGCEVESLYSGGRVLPPPPASTEPGK